MLRRTSLILALSFLASGVGAAGAGPSATISWDACDPVIVHRSFTGQAVYQAVISGTGWGGRYRGHRFDLVWHAPSGGLPPEWWRIDVSVCIRGANFPSHTTSSVDPGCPNLGAPDFLDRSFTRMPFFGQPQDTPGIRLVAGFPGVDGVATTRYTLWRVLFDLTYAEVGPDPICGGAELPVCFQLVDGDYTDDLGIIHHDIALENTLLHWQNPAGDCLGAVPVRAGTWGAIKAQYR